LAKIIDQLLIFLSEFLECLGLVRRKPSDSLDAWDLVMRAP
jgi:hypothetical protein